MAHYPKPLRDGGPDVANYLFSQSLFLDYYDQLSQDSVFFFHNYTYVFYQNFTSSLEVNGVYMNID
jgi:hypothetical protein